MKGHCWDMDILLVYAEEKWWQFVCMCVCVQEMNFVCLFYNATTHLPASYFSCVISAVALPPLFFPILGIWEAKLSVSNLWKQPAQRQMFGADVPAASNNTTPQQLSTQAGRRQCRIGRAEGWETDTQVDVDIIAKRLWKDSRKEVMWEAYVWDKRKHKERIWVKGKSTPNTHYLVPPHPHL